MSSIEKFNQLLRQELTVVHIYTAILRAAPGLACFNQLVESLHCHQGRADLIAGEIRQLKGRPGWLTEAPQLNLTGEEALCILADHEETTSRKYSGFLHDSDFAVQLLARRLQNRQIVTASAVATYSERISKVA